MNFVDKDGRRRTFCRLVTSSTSSEYRIDGNVVTPPAYRQGLMSININIKAKNFLVYQGAVEQVAMRSPKELTLMFEELSKSIEFASDYDKLGARMMKTEADLKKVLDSRRVVYAEKKDAKVAKDYANHYQAG